MYAGIAGALLWMTGIWHATEFLMDGRRRDTLALIPVGIVYVILGYLIVNLIGGTPVHIVALVITAAGMTFAYLRRNQLDIRKWVTWAFIIIDIVIVLSLLVSLLG